MKTSARSEEVAVSFKERPVMKVVRLLKDMQAELQKDLDDDKAVHEKLSCWCSDNDKEKTQAIETGTQRSEQLKATMDEATAKILELKAKRKSTMEEMYSDQKALGTATALRMKENQGFHMTETSLLDAISAAKQAIVVLSEHHPELAQLRSVATRLQEARVAQLFAPRGNLRSSQLAALKDFLQQAGGASSLLAIPGFQSYRPQSGQIFGILKQMVQDFEASLADEQKAELKAKTDHESLKAAKEQQISSAQKAVAQMDSDIADNGEKHAQAFQEHDDTQAQLALDSEFLANLKKKCSESSAEFDTRVKSRLEEIAAVQDTVKILNADEAFDNFDKTVNVALFQTGASRGGSFQKQLRARAAGVLQRAAGKHADPKLALLAAEIKLDSFEKVKVAIDKMMTELKNQQADEVRHRDWCTDELASNERETAAAYDKKSSLEARIADLDKTVGSLTAEIEATKKSIANLQDQMKRASELREAENADYQETIVDHRLTQMILAKALDRMQQVYAMVQSSEEPEQPGAAHIETSGNHTDPGNGPARFTKYEQHAGGSRVVAMLKKVLADSQQMEDEAITAEEDAQVAYEDFMKDSNKGIAAANVKLNNLSGARARAKESLSMAKTDLRQTVQELEGLNNVLGDLHKSCDFLLKNFDARQAARAAEIEALKEAKAILSGMK
uniref:Uncharacterized protein n=1 Tax=Alexandrium catenella TaxID=2925 RepID=A0A7S1LKS7_ALECA